ncbi:hypothetical protein ACE1TF_19985 [Geomicrobium sp. JSM 1781026]|uniref:hypothetical protein n=1 Tax=Geomicrobium sp. JSM 1781026 TaxID=3344580 RepID=UPI0035C20139
MGVKRWGAIWGFAEATVFFIVPDVLITYAALTKTRTFIVWLCLYTLIGALVGGTLMYALGIGFVKEGNELLTHIPAIDAQLVADVQQSLIESGLIAMLLGPTQGIPYKIFALNAYHADVYFWLFIIISVPARVIRFLLAGLLVSFISQTLLKRQSKTVKVVLWLSFWVIFYTFYFIGMT